ncbi:MAG: thiamine phosphate synthase [Endomicrobiales bacterium]|nr:thiamine phosphate synthase [Endomicrobiales bacterium]
MHININLYCVTLKRDDLSYEEQVERACEGGADAVQLRDSDLPAKEIISLGKTLKNICHEKKVLFIVNDRPDLAVAIDCDGVHLGQDDISVEYARKILGPGKIIGCSTSSLGQALEAVREGANYVSVGPVFKTPIKPGKEAHGVDLIRIVKNRVKVPVIAIGGINQDNVQDVVQSGADGIAVVRAVCGADDIKKSAQQLKQKILNLKKEMVFNKV